MNAAPLQLTGALKSKLRHSRGKLADAINWAPGAAQVAAAIRGSLMEDVSVAKENVVSRGNLERLVLASCVVGGTLLTIIGIRYFIVPESAAYTFGLAEPPTGYEMHYIIALRNVWLGLLAIAFVLFRQWYALAPCLPSQHSRFGINSPHGRSFLCGTRGLDPAIRKEPH